MIILTIPKTRHEECIDITDVIQNYIDQTQLVTGLLTVHTPEDCTALTVLSPITPDVPRDYLEKLNHLLPKYNGMQFTGKNTQSVKASIAGKNLSLIICDGQLALGKYQRAYFVEFAGPATDRHIFLNAIGEKSETAEAGTTLSDFHQAEGDKVKHQKAEEQRIIEEMRQEYLNKQKESNNA